MPSHSPVLRRLALILNPAAQNRSTRNRCQANDLCDRALKAVGTRTTGSCDDASARRCLCSASGVSQSRQASARPPRAKVWAGAGGRPAAPPPPWPDRRHHRPPWPDRLRPRHGRLPASGNGGRPRRHSVLPAAASGHGTASSAVLRRTAAPAAPHCGAPTEIHRGPATLPQRPAMARPRRPRSPHSRPSSSPAPSARPSRQDQIASARKSVSSASSIDSKVQERQREMLSRHSAERETRINRLQERVQQLQSKKPEGLGRNARRNGAADAEPSLSVGSASAR